MSFVLHALAMFCLAVGATLAMGAFVEVRQALTLWRARRVKARDVAGERGIVDVHGTVTAVRPLLGPLTGRACVQFIVVMERAQPHGTQSRDGEPDLITFIESAPFSLTDGTGRVAIDLTAQRVPVTGARIVRQPLERLTAPLEKMLAAKLHKPGGVWCMNRDVTATEAALLDGDEVSVVARAHGGVLTPLHITTGRVRVVALQALVRAGMAGAIAGMLLVAWNWLR